MWSYLARRLLAVIPLLLAATFLTQVLMIASPGDYFSALQENPNITKEYLDQLRAEFHLDTKNPFVRYGYWVKEAVRGNFGYSFKYNMPVWNLIWERAGNTLVLALCAMAISWGVALPLGVVSAVKRDSIIDRLCGVIAYFGLSIPSVFFALLMLLLASKTGWFPIGGMRDQIYWDDFTTFEKIKDVLWHVTLPAIVTGTIGMAQYMRQMRGEMIETLSQDYIRTARAKGLSNFQVIFGHAFGNAINPLVTLFGFSLAYLLAGSLIVEIVFAWPGMGRLTFDAVFAKDEPLVMASIVLLIGMLAIGNLVADLLLAAIDPRIRLE